MWVAILVFLIINFILLGLFCYFLISVCLDDKKRIVRKCNILDYENGDLKLSLYRARKALATYKQKHPHASKLVLGQMCYGIVKDKIKYGKVKVIAFLEDGLIQYVIQQLDGKEFFINEDHVLSEAEIGNLDIKTKKGGSYAK